MRSQGELRAFLVYVFYCRGATVTELGEIRKRKVGATSYDSADPEFLELPLKCIEKTYDHNATRPSGYEPEKDT